MSEELRVADKERKDLMKAVADIVKKSMLREDEIINKVGTDKCESLALLNEKKDKIKELRDQLLNNAKSQVQSSSLPLASQMESSLH